MTVPLLAAVVGSPISQSLSPAIHEAAFRADGRLGRYDAVDCPREQLPDVVSSLRRGGVVGISVTMPCKEAMAELCDELDRTAALLRAVNCVKFEGDRVLGFNTDGDGCCDALSEQGGVVWGGGRAVMLGAGGTARSVGLALLRRGTSVVVVNRTPERAEALVAMLAGAVDGAPEVRTGSTDDIDSADILVNTTSVGMGSEESPVDSGVLHRGLTVLDAVYHPLRTSLLAAAEGAGARTVDGLWMLIHQARRQQEIWFGSKPDSGPMRAESERVLWERATSL